VPGADDHKRKDDWLYVFHGDVEWVEALKASLDSGSSVGIEEAYPDEWELIRYMPEVAPEEIIGAGFGKLDEEFMSGLGDQIGSLGSDVETIVDAVKVKSAAFGLYSADFPEVLPEFDADFLEGMDASGLVVTKTGYPGFIVSFIFGRAASGAGLQKMDIMGGDAYHKAMQEDLHVLVKNVGSAFFVTGAADLNKARALMESVLEEQ
jgi:hypothetical protein